MVITTELRPSRFLFGAPSEQRYVNESVNTAAYEVLQEAYEGIDASFGPKNLRRLFGSKSFSYFAQEVILKSLADDIDKYFAEGSPDNEVSPFLQILDAAQQKGAVLSQAVLQKAYMLSERVADYGRRYNLPNQLQTMDAQGRIVDYIFPKDLEGRMHLVKVVSPDTLTLAQRSELQTAQEIAKAITPYNTKLGGPRLVEITINTLTGKQDRRKIGWYAINFEKSDITLATKGPAYPNAPETEDALRRIPFLGKDWQKQYLTELKDA